MKEIVTQAQLAEQNRLVAQAHAAIRALSSMPTSLNRRRAALEDIQGSVNVELWAIEEAMQNSHE